MVYFGGKSSSMKKSGILIAVLFAVALGFGCHHGAGSQTTNMDSTAVDSMVEQARRTVAVDTTPVAADTSSRMKVDTAKKVR